MIWLIIAIPISGLIGYIFGGLMVAASFEEKCVDCSLRKSD